MDEKKNIRLPLKASLITNHTQQEKTFKKKNPTMSLDSQDSPSPSFNRDWFFPSPSFIHQSPPKTPKPYRRFSTSSKHSPDSNLSNPPSFRSSSSFSPTTTSKYGRLRRRMEFPRTPDKYSRQHQNDFVLDRKLAVSNEKKQSTEKLSSRSLGHRVRVRWNLAITVAVSIYIVMSLTTWLCESKRRSFFFNWFFFVGHCRL